jgi:CheY-like chemotaxis protein
VDIRARVAALERDNTLIKSAFILNDINLPDFDGHRTDHRIRKEAAKIMESYKITATHKVIAAVMAALVLFFSTGITTKLQALVQTKETK